MSFLCKWFGINCPKPVPPTPPSNPDRWLSVDVSGPTEFSGRLILDAGKPIIGERTEPAAPWHMNFRVPGSVTCGASFEITPSGDDATRYKVTTVRLSVGGKTVDELGHLPVADTQCDPIECAVASAPRRSQDELRHVMTNFCNLRDSKNRVVFTAFLPALSAEERDEWYELQRQNGSTHIAISAQAGYPGSPIPSFDLRNDPAQLAAIVKEILRTPSADGKGFTPIIFLDSGEAGIKDRIDIFWSNIRAAIGDDEADCIIVPGWELVNASAVTSEEYSYALTTLYRHGWSHIWAHLAPGRAACSSNPIERDDPWQGGESDCWKTHGGQYVEGLLYQAEATRPNDDQMPDTEGWLDRWNDVVPRLGKGMNGWRIMHLCFFESQAYYYYRGQSDSAFCRRIATRAKQLADKYGVTAGNGNGIPY